jgi:hypothetical protein
MIELSTIGASNAEKSSSRTPSQTKDPGGSDFASSKV